jgi:hypothetical protein
VVQQVQDRLGCVDLGWQAHGKMGRKTLQTIGRPPRCSHTKAKKNHRGMGAHIISISDRLDERTGKATIIGTNPLPLGPERPGLSADNSSLSVLSEDIS